MGEKLINVTARPGRRRWQRSPAQSCRAFTLIELLMTVLVIQIVSMLVLVCVGNVEAPERVDRAVNETIAALRYARMLSMASGQSCGVEFNTSTGTIRVFKGAAMTTVADSQIQGGTYVINLNSQSNVRGVTISQVLIANDATNPYQVWFGTLGQTANNGFVTFTYGTASRSITIPTVGECQ
jgi:Tfp pilus assembly protein FimT